MSTMFGSFRGPFRTPRRGLSIFGTLVSLGVCGCGTKDDAENPGPVPTDSSLNPASSTSPGTPTNTSSTGVNPVVPQPVNPVTPPTGPGVTPPVSPSVQPTTGGVSPEPTPVAPQPTSTAPGPAPTDTMGETTAPVAPAGTCQITASGEISSNIATVGIVSFTSDVAVTNAKIEFTNMAGGETFTAPVDLDAPGYRTLLLGMKPNATYTYKVVVNDTCSSAEGSLTTGNVPVSGTDRIPRISKTGSGGQPGFYVVSVYSANTHSVILDQDGDIVWYGGGATAGMGDGTSRSRMDWEGKYMWSIAANPFAGGRGAIRRVSMDGAEDTTMLPGTENPHHDLTAVPGGIMTILAHQTQGNCSRILEYKPDGTATEIVTNINDLYGQAQDCHPNSISYNVDDDTYVVGDRNASMFVKFDRQGQVIWQLGGANPKGASFQGVTNWSISHGHHLFEQDGALRMLVFNNAQGGTSYVLEFSLDEDAMTAQQVWSQSVAATPVMGDVQRLPNGNTLVALTTAGRVVEYQTGTSQTVQEFGITGGQVGYVDFRPTLYGIPAKARFDYTKFD